MEEKKVLVRNDINIEKWPIFTTKKAKGVRTYERSVTLPNGEKDTQSVTIGLENSTETLTTSEEKIFYTLLDIWAKSGRPKDGKIYKHLGSIFNTIIPSKDSDKLVKRGNWSKNWLLKKLKRMLTIPLLYQHAYENKDGTVRQMESFTLLSKVSLYERKFDQKQKYFDFSWFVIHPVIIESLLTRNVKPIRLDVFCKLQSDTAIMLYRWLDLIMADKSNYEKIIDDQLATDLGLEQTRYDNLIRNLQDACAELKDQELTTGRISSCSVERTVDDMQYKLVVQKCKYIELPVPEVQEVESQGSGIDYFNQLFEALNLEQKQEVNDLTEKILDEKYGGYKESTLSKESAFAEAVKTIISKSQIKVVPKTEVTISYNGNAKAVSVAGSFNKWKPKKMRSSKQGWKVTLPLHPGEYHYKLVVDDQWILDPANHLTLLDEKGNQNSMLKVENPNEPYEI